MNGKVLGFSVDTYVLAELNKIPANRLYEIALEDSENTMIYDNVGAWFNDLNEDFVDTENMFWIAVPN